MRNTRDPLFDVFDAPFWFTSASSRNTTTTPVQSLFLINSQLMLQRGKAFVPRLVRELSAPVDTVTLRRPSLDDVFLKLTGRAIRDEEVSARDRNRAMASRWMGRRR